MIVNLKYWQLLIACAIAAPLIRYTYKNGHYWLVAIEILILLFLFLRWIVAVYNEHVENKKKKDEWEKVGGRIILYNKLLNPNLAIDRDQMFALPIGTLRYWQDWVAKHPADEKARQALIDICTKTVRAPHDCALDPAARAEAQLILDKLAPSVPAPGNKTIVPINNDKGITCGSCNRQMIYKGKDAPFMKAIKGEYAMYCRACGRYICIPCVVVAEGTQDINACAAKVMTGQGKCPCCGALSVNLEKGAT